jgi:hypothetical protein
MDLPTDWFALHDFCTTSFFTEIEFSVETGQKGFHIFPHRLVGGAGLVEKGGSLVRSELQRSVQNFFYLLPALRSHTQAARLIS